MRFFNDNLAISSLDSLAIVRLALNSVSLQFRTSIILERQVLFQTDLQFEYR